MRKNITKGMAYKLSTQQTEEHYALKLPQIGEMKDEDVSACISAFIG